MTAPATDATRERPHGYARYKLDWSCHGNPADWLTPDSPLSPGRWTTSSHHRRVELTEQEIGLRVRCHDCGAIARENWDRHRARFDADGWNVVPESDPTPWALDRLDRGPCEPLGQGDLLELIGAPS